MSKTLHHPHAYSTRPSRSVLLAQAGVMVAVVAVVAA